MTVRSLITHLFKQQSYTRGWASLTLINLVSRGLGFLLFVTIPRVFNVGTTTDLFFFFTNLSLRTNNFLGSINRSVLIPHAISLRESGKGAEGAYTYRKISSIYITIFLVATLWVAAFSDTAMPIISRFAPSVIADSRLLIAGLSLYVFLELATLALSDWLFCMRYFALPATLGLIGALFYLLSVLATSSSFGISGLITSMVIFKFIQIGILAIFASKNFSLAKTSLPAGFKTKILAVYGSSAFSLVFETLPFFLLSSFGPGSITSLVYAQLLASIPSLLLVEQTHQLLGVRFFELGASKDIKHINESFEITLDCLMIFLIPLCALLWMIGGDLFQLIFGRSFEPSLLVNIKCLFNLLIWIPPLMVINGFTSQVLLGQHHTVSNAVQQIASMSLGIGMLFFFINRDGVAGYGKGMVYFYLFNVVAVGFTCALVMRDFALFRGLYRGFWKGVLLGVVSLIFAELGNRFFGNSNPFIQLLTVGGFFCVGYLTGFLIIDRTLSQGLSPLSLLVNRKTTS